MSSKLIKKELIELFFRYQTLVDTVKRLPGAIDIAIELEPLLITITQAWHEGAPFQVRKLLIREGLGSPATIHKRIHQLQKAGLVSLEAIASDARVRLVVPTEQALRYFAERGKAVQKAGH